MSNHKYELKTYNGRVKVYVDGFVILSFSISEFKGYYSYQNDNSVYGITIYLASTKIETSYEEKEIWLSILRLLDKHL